MAFRASFNISDITPDQGYFISANGAGLRWGYNPVNLGDIDNDGQDDFAFFRGPGQPEQMLLFTGQIGRLDDGQLNQAEADGYGTLVTGMQSNGRLTEAVGLGDINGDGIDDFAVAEQAYDLPGLVNAGRVHIIFGGSDLQEGTLATGQTIDQIADVTIDGTIFDQRLGVDLVALGDVNGDGIGDIGISAGGGNPNYYGQFFVLYGGQDWTDTPDLAALDGDQGFSIGGASFKQNLGTTGEGLGDVNGDGIDDFLIGAPAQANSSPTSVAEAYVIFGRAGGYDTDLILSGEFDGFRLTQSTSGLGPIGAVVSSLGDIDQDGLADFAIGFPQATPGGTPDAGITLVVYGRDNTGTGLETIDVGTLLSGDGSTHMRINGSANGGLFGNEVTALGDVNGDGFDDFAVSGNGGAGAVAVVYGGLRDSFQISVDDLAADPSLGYVITNDATGEGFADPGAVGGAGDTVMALGDLNFDGTAEFFITSFTEDSVAVDAGGGYVINGALSDADDLLNGTDIGNDIYGGDGNDTINGLGGDDTLVGGNGDDRLDGGAGNDFIVAGTGDDVASGGDGRDVINGFDGADTLDGGAGNDRLFGGNGDDTLNGGDGDDVMLGQGGADSYDGGAGVDTVSYSNDPVSSTSTEGATVYLAGNDANAGLAAGDTYANVENIVGSVRDDTIVGDNGANRLDGARGDDVVIGDVAVALDGVEGQIFRAYQAALGRAPDVAGFDLFVGDVVQGNQSQLDVIEEFVTSAEFNSVYGTLTDRQFVEQIYRNVLDREGEATGVDAFTAAIENGDLTRAEVVQEFANSPEFIGLSTLTSAAFGATSVGYGAQQGALFRLYEAVFDRDPDFAGFSLFNDALNLDLLDLDAIAAEFVTSPEFQDTYGALSNADFVELLYTNVLPGNQDANGRAAFTAALDNGDLTRADVVLEFSQSAEFRQSQDAATDAFIDLWSANSDSDDTLVLGWDNDTAYGGVGADTFFVRDFGATETTIADFEIGVDVLDLSDTNADTFAIVQTRMSQDGLDTLIDLSSSGDGSHVLRLRNTDMNDLTAADFGEGTNSLAEPKADLGAVVSETPDVALSGMEADFAVFNTPDTVPVPAALDTLLSFIEGWADDSGAFEDMAALYL